MKISLNWLKDFISLSNISAEEIKERLTQHTVEVEEIISQKKQFDNIVVAEIIKIEKHPQADKLQIATVRESGEKELRIVCGAPNISEGQRVPLAKIGASLNNGLEIKPIEIRGIQSSGMLCSESELGLSKDHSGIMILDKSARPGERLADYLKLNDTILEIDNKSMSHRPDLWSHYGIARELAVIFKKKLKDYPNKEIKIKNKNKNKKEDNISLEIKTKNLCQKYLALKIDGIKVNESPEWLKQRLSTAGLRPINNIVDVSNYVMLELGQPLHIFDAKNIDKIIVKKASKNEVFITLDGEERKLDEEDLIISSNKETLAIAGVMGGKNSEVNKTTTSIIIESANFDAVSVRKTAQRLNLRTDASVRFEKGPDLNLCQVAINKAAELIKQINPQAEFKYPLVEESFSETRAEDIDLDLNWAEKIIGQKIENKEIKNILESLGIKIKEKEENLWSLSIPSWRQRDLQIKEDIVEDIIRIYGYDNIKIAIPFSQINPPKKIEERELIKSLKLTLSLSYKMSEVYNYAFTNEDQLRKLNIESSNHLKILNPLSSQYTLMKQSLIPHLILNIKTNQAKYNRISLFEIAKVFFNIPGDLNRDNKKQESLPHQENKLGLVLSEQEGDSFTGLKNIIANALEELSAGLIIDFTETETLFPWSDAQEKCLIFADNKELGVLAKVDDNILKKNGIKQELSVLELDIKSLLDVLNKRDKKYQGLAKFPAINRDLAFVIDEKILYNKIYREIKNFNSLIIEAELFDVYSGDKIERGKKSLAFHLSYQDKERTLTNEEIDLIQKDLIAHFEEKFSAQIRDF